MTIQKSGKAGTTALQANGFTEGGEDGGDPNQFLSSGDGWGLADDPGATGQAGWFASTNLHNSTASDGPWRSSYQRAQKDCDDWLKANPSGTCVPADKKRK